MVPESLILLPWGSSDRVSARELQVSGGMHEPGEAGGGRIDEAGGLGFFVNVQLADTLRQHLHRIFTVEIPRNIPTRKLYRVFFGFFAQKLIVEIDLKKV